MIENHTKTTASPADVWLGSKKVINGRTVQKEYLIDEMSIEELKNAINYCDTMLNNEDPEKPGRKIKLAKINEQIRKCNVSIYLQEQIQKESLITIHDALANKDNRLKLSDFMDVKAEFYNITVKLAMDAVMDKLGVFNKNVITLNSLVFNRGVYISPSEYEAYNFKNLSQEEKISDVRKILDLHENVPVKLSPFGFSIDEIKKAISIKDCKYSELDIESLRLLRDKILYNSAEKMISNIRFWTLKKGRLLKTFEEKLKA